MTALTCVSSAALACNVCSFISMMFSMNILFFPHCQAMEGPGTPGSLQRPWDPISLGLGIARTLDTAGMLDAAGMLPGCCRASGCPGGCCSHFLLWFVSGNPALPQSGHLPTV